MAAVTFPLSCFVALAVGGEEVTVPGYARQPVTLEYCADAVTISNTASQQWQHAVQPWGTIDTVELWDSLSGGAHLASLAVAAPLFVDQYDIARIPASGLTVTHSLVGRPFGSGLFGTLTYGTTEWETVGAGVLLQLAFGQQTHICEPGTWSPGPFSLAA